MDLIPLSIPCNCCPASSGIRRWLRTSPPLSLSPLLITLILAPRLSYLPAAQFTALALTLSSPHSHLLSFFSPWRGFFCCSPFPGPFFCHLCCCLLLLLASCAASRLTFGGRRCLKAHPPEPLDIRDNGYPALALFLSSSSEFLPISVVGVVLSSFLWIAFFLGEDS